jgi:hypothetical protein
MRTSWYEEAAGRKKGDARRRAKLFGECRIFGQKAAVFAPLIILVGRLRARSKM